jgi:hypothetical protein
MRPVNGYVPEVLANAVTAVREPVAASMVTLSNEAKDRYVADQNESETSSDVVKQAGEEAMEKSGASEASESGKASDPVGDTLKKLQQLLKEAQERLRVAQQQMAQAMAGMKNAGDEMEKMSAMLKVQAAQTLVISAQGDVLQIYAEINQVMEEQQKQH